MRRRRAFTIAAAVTLAAFIGACARGTSRGFAGVASPSDLSPGDIALLGALLAAADTRRPDTATIDHALAAPHPRLRAFGARVIGQVQVTSRVPRLRTVIGDPDSSVAADAAFSLGLVRDSLSVAALRRALSGPPTVIDAAAWSLGEIGEPARPALEEILRAGQPEAAVPAVLQTVAKLRPVPAALVAPYLENASLVVRRNAAYALSRSRIPAATRSLITAAGRPDASQPLGLVADSAARLSADFRSYIARGLTRSVAGDSLADAAIAALASLVDDPQPHVRINAIRSLATYGERARPALLRRARDIDPNVRVTLAQSLNGVLPSESGDWTSVWNADTGFTFRSALLATALRSGVHLPALDARAATSWQHHSDWRYRFAAAEAAGAGVATDVELIAGPLLRDSDARVRNAAYGAALPWADSTAAASMPWGRASLSAALGDSDLFVRASILDAIRVRAHAADVSLAVRAWQLAGRDPENDARIAALRVIAAAWSADSDSFGAGLRDSLRLLPAPIDPLERAVVRDVSPLRAWTSNTHADARAASWYVDQVRAFVAPAPTRLPHATIVTERGSIELAFYGTDAPLTAANFLGLARRGYYDGLTFHRVVPNFVAQDGDPRGDGRGGPGYAIRDELNRHWYDRGAVGMALSGPDTGGSQYFLTHSPQPHLDGHYTVFAHVVAGLSVLDALVQGDRIMSIKVQ